MGRTGLESALIDGSQQEAIRATYLVNQKEVYISFKKGMAQQGDFYIVDKVGKNIRLFPVPPYLVKNHPEDPRHRKVRAYTGRSPCIALPDDLAEPGQLFRIVKSVPTGTIWLIRINSFVYADEASIPPEVLCTSPPTDQDVVSK